MSLMSACAEAVVSSFVIHFAVQAIASASVPFPRGALGHVAVDQAQHGHQGDQLGAFDPGVAVLLEVDGEGGDHLGDVEAAGALDLGVDLSGSGDGWRGRWARLAGLLEGAQRPQGWR